MPEKDLNLICVACGYEVKAPREMLRATCPECGQQVLNEKSKSMLKRASLLPSKAKRSKKQ